MNRTTAVVVPGASAVDYSFNADASPEVVGDRIRLRLTADAVVPVEAEKADRDHSEASSAPEPDRDPQRWRDRRDRPRRRSRIVANVRSERQGHDPAYCH